VSHGRVRILKYILYNLMAKRATSCVCELRPALNVPNVYDSVALGISSKLVDTNFFGIPAASPSSYSFSHPTAIKSEYADQ
jgi:hypothetical protein